jgi:hypothetical protein
LVITPPLFTLSTSALVPVKVVVPLALKPPAVMVKVGTLFAELAKPSVSEPMLVAAIGEL